jgi:RHS repeat-associated protein
MFASRNFTVFLLAFLLATPLSAQTFSWTTTSQSGGESSGVHTRFWSPGLNVGYFNFSYDFYNIPDSVAITFGGQSVYNSGGYVSGASSVSLAFGPSRPGTTPLLQVTMNQQGPRPGTAWTYTLTPTGKPVLQSLSIQGPFSLGAFGVGTYVAVAGYSTGSTRVIPATWASSSALLKLFPRASHADALAGNVTEPSTAVVSAKYSEDGINVSAIYLVALAQQALTNNPNEESKKDPDADREKEGGPVDVASGAESFYRPLISVAGAHELEFGLHYNSAFAGVASPVGRGWSHPFAARITQNGDEVTVIWSPTRQNTFRLVRASTGAYYRCPDQDVRNDVLAKLSDGGFSYTKLDQTVHTFNSNGSLTQLANARGQRITISASGTSLSTLTEAATNARLTFTHTSGLMTRITDTLGRQVNLAYDANGFLTSITDPNGSTTTYAYNAGGRLERVTAPGGVEIYRNTYDTLGRVVSQNDARADNKLLTFKYDEKTRPGHVITTVTDRNGAVTIYTHDQSFRLLTVKNAINGTTSHTYDGNGNRVSTRDPLGRLIQMSYDSRGNLTRTTLPDGTQSSFTYDARNNITRVINADGRTATTDYDATNNPTRSVDFSGGTTTRTFNANSQVLTEISPRGHTTTFAYTSGRLTSVTDPVGNVRRFTYDSAGRVLTTTDPANKVTTFTYSATSKVLTETSPVGGVTRRTYDVRDRLATLTDPVGGVTTWAYDGNSNITQTTDALGGVTSRAYDGEDRLIRETDPLSRVTTYAYDALGRLITSKNPLNQTTTFVYDAVGNRTKVTNAAGESTTTIYSTTDLASSVTDPLGRKTDQARDSLGRVTTVTDPLRRITARQYDAQGRSVSEADGLGLTVRRAYAADGLLTTLTNAAGAAYIFAYDNAGRQTTLLTPGNRTTAWQYDGRNLITRLTEPSSQITNNTYDDAGRLVTRADPVGTTTYTYDVKGRPLTVTEGGKTITRVYDALDRLTRFTDGNGNVIEYAYDAVGNLVRLTYPGGRQVQYEYDQANRMTRVLDWAARSTTYRYDVAGRMVEMRRANGTRHLRTYDKAGQVTSLRELPATGTTTLNTYTVGYDAAGQITTELRSPTAPVFVPPLDVMTYDADDRLISFNGTAVTQDADGNMTQGPLGGAFAPFTYDARNRLTSAGGISYAYDAENRRISSTQSGAVTTYVNHPNAALWQVLTYRTGTGAVTFCVHGLGLLYTVTDDVPLYHHHDLRGSTIATTNQAGAVTFTTHYGTYGERLPISPGAAPTPFLFVGQHGVITDANGLYYSRARYYHPAIRRFINADPIGFEGGMNWYAYAGGSPNNRIDPSGHLWWLIPIAIEAGMTAWDAWETHKVLNDPKSTAAEKGLATATFIAGLGLPGAGYGAAGRYADDVYDAARRSGAGTETVQRWMSRAELEATQSTGLMRGGRDGTHYVTDAANSSAQRARLRTALPQTPEVRVTLEVPGGVFSTPSRVQPAFGMPGGGMERTANGQIPVRILNVDGKP